MGIKKVDRKSSLLFPFLLFFAASSIVFRLDLDLDSHKRPSPQSGSKKQGLNPESNRRLPLFSSCHRHHTIPLPSTGPPPPSSSLPSSQDQFVQHRRGVAALFGGHSYQPLGFVSQPRQPGRIVLLLFLL